MVKVPPHDLAIERAILSAFMADPRSYSEVADSLQASFFYQEKHREVYAAIATLGEATDLVSVTRLLRKREVLDKVGGPAYIAELSALVSGSYHLETHIKILIALAVKRDVFIVSSEVKRDAFEDTVDPFSLLDQTTEALWNIPGSARGREALSIGELTPLVTRQIELNAARNSDVTGIPTGFRELDALTAGWQNSDLIVIAARPGQGKTQISLNLAITSSFTHKIPTAFFSLEMSASQLSTRIMSAQGNIHASSMRTGRLRTDEFVTLNDLVGSFKNTPLYINDSPRLDFTQFRSNAIRLVKQKGVKIIFLDYFQLLDTGSGNRASELAKISRGMKALAKELQIPIIELSQMSRENLKRKDMRPNIGDLRETGSIEQDADLVLFIHRPEYYGQLILEDGSSSAGVTELILAKQRNGPIATVPLHFDGSFQRFTDLPAC